MIDILSASESAPGGGNDDFFMVAPTWALVLDGVSAYPVPDVGCQHTVSWFSRHLGSHIATLLATDHTSPLRDVLGEAIRRTAADHGPGCDLTHPLTPAATVALARITDDEVHWLVLGDATVAWQTSTGIADAVTDDRADRLVGAPIINADVRRYDPAYVANVRNKPGGFWVAAADPEASGQALTGNAPRPELAHLGLFSDGVTRLVERYEHTWADIFTIADHHGASKLIGLVRQAEREDQAPERWRGKLHDDATAVVLRPRSTG